MSGGLRLFLAFTSLLLFAAAVRAVNDSKAPTVSTAPPKAEVKPVQETLHGTRIIDNYRWLEDGTNPETQKWVQEELSYTRSVLDPLPGRDLIHKRLTE